MRLDLSNKTNEELLAEAEERITAAMNEIGTIENAYNRFYNIPSPSHNKSNIDQNQTPQSGDSH